MFSNKRARITVVVFFTFFFVNLIPIMAYDSNEQAEEKEAQGKERVVLPPAISQELLIIGEAKPYTFGEAKPYTLGREDVLQIIVRNQPEFSGQFVIGPDGKLQYNFVGDIKAAGLTKDQLKERLIKELERFVKVPEISIAITAYRSKNVYILGEVARPGKYPMKGDVLSLRDAIVGAGLPTRDAALRRIYIVKSDPADPTYRKVDLYRLLYKGRLKDNINLVSGDIVVVPSTVPSEFNRALNNLLSPFFKAAVIDDLFNTNR